MTRTKKTGSKSISSGYCSPTAVSDAEPFFNEIEALAKLYADDAKALNRTSVKLRRKLPMLTPEDFNPLNTILICRNPEERILILKEISDINPEK